MGVLLAVATGACNGYKLDLGRDDPRETAASQRKPALWTLFDTYKALVEGRPVTPTDSFPNGFPAETFLNPNPAGDGTATLRIIPAFSEGGAAAYVVPEIWVNFDRIWVQPWYVLVTAYGESGPVRLRTADGENYPPVWDVSHRSLFYNPFWLLFYAVVPEDSPADHYTSAEKLFNENRPIYPGPPWIYSVRPDQITLDAKPVHPYLKTDVAAFLRQFPISWVDDEPVAYFDEGLNNFKYDPHTLEVEEVPMFILSKRDANGAPQPMGVPNVVGTGPLMARRPPEIFPTNRPRFGSYTRWYFAIVGARAGAFDPDAWPAARDALVAKMIDPEAYRGRVASNGLPGASTMPGGMPSPSCFASPMFPTSCTWLDSQAAVEDAAGFVNIKRTEISACTPIVFYNNKGVGR
jgi:hypothetical protein